MNEPDYATTFSVDQTPDQVIAAINDVRAWWSEGIAGDAGTLGSEFTLEVPGIHRSVQKVVEIVPGKRVVWRVLDADLTFVADTSEWVGTEIRFELTDTGRGTEVRFSHLGLVPAFQCFDVCSNAWSTYINGSLRDLITTGIGQPIEADVDDLELARADVAPAGTSPTTAQDRALDGRSFTTTFSVDQTPERVFAAINDVAGWWNKVEGTTDRVGSEFLYEVADVHRCAIRVTELVPAERIVWLVLENHFSFTQDPTEWTGTEIRFEISREDGRTRVRFEHVGLVPEYECFDICANAWGGYIDGSLRRLIETGTGRPNDNVEGLARVDERRRRLSLAG